MSQSESKSRSLPERLDAAQRCPNCQDQGWYVVPNRNTGEPEQEQCEFCCTVPDSLFNVHAEVKAALSENAESAAMQDVWSSVRLKAEGADWDRDHETLAEWVWRKL
jgi:hypothetical protein